MESLKEELDRWGEAGRCAELWWRDDDAGAPRPELAQLLDLTQGIGIPLHLAVIPAQARADLFAGRKVVHPVRLLPHGWSHLNHEPAGSFPSELGDARPLGVTLTEIAKGVSRLRELFGAEQVLPVLVPPWHSISRKVAENLPQIGIRGLSTLGSRKLPLGALSIVQINAHVDVINWLNAPSFIGFERALSQLLDQLRARRMSRTDAHEPVGLLTHHWAIDHECWKFLESVGRMVNGHPSAKWIVPDWSS